MGTKTTPPPSPVSPHQPCSSAPQKHEEGEVQIAHAPNLPQDPHGAAEGPETTSLPPSAFTGGGEGA